MFDAWGRFIQLAEERDGAVGLDDARTAGIGDDVIRAWTRRGRISRTGPQTYRVPGSPDTWRQRVRVAVATEGPLAVASRQTAAVLHGLRGFRPGIIHVTAPRWRRRKRRGIVVHESRVLDACDVTVIDGIRVTSLVRTLIDLAACVPAYLVGVAMDDAVRTGRTTYQAIRERVEELAVKGRRGINTMRHLLASRPGGRCLDRSELERRVFRILVKADLPEPVQNHRVRVAGQVHEIDLAWPEALLGIEAQSEEHHMDHHHFHHDPERMSRLQAIGGWTIVLVTSKRLKNPRSLIVEVATLLHRAGIELSASVRRQYVTSETPEGDG